MENLDALPVMFEHCVEVYEALNKKAVRDPVTGDVVWEGFMTKLINDDLGKAMPYYTAILRNLKRMGCIQQARRGGSTTPSQWVLYHAPSRDLWDATPDRKNHNSKGDAMQAQILDLARRVDALERMLRDGVELMKSG